MRSTGSVLFLLLLWPLSSIAPQAPAPRTELTAGIRAAVIDSAAQLLARRYVEADTGRLLADHLKARLRARSYDGLDQPGQFAEAVTRDLRALNGDLHLGLRYVPGRSSGGGDGPDPVRQNFGIARAEVLEGNVGYLEISGFLGAPGYQDAVVDALQLLSRTDALIIDLRRNGGGSGEMSHFVFSHFLGATPVPTIRVTRRAAGQDRGASESGHRPRPASDGCSTLHPDEPEHRVSRRGVQLRASEPRPRDYRRHPDGRRRPHGRRGPGGP